MNSRICFSAYRHSALLLLGSLLSVLLANSCSPSGEAFWPPEKSPPHVSKLVTGDLLARPDFMMYDWGGVQAVHYAEICTAFGAARLAGLLGDTSTIRLLVERYNRVVRDSIPNTANHVDANVYGILPLELFKHTKDSALYQQGMDLAIGQWKDPLPDGLSRQTRYWIDDVWMIGSLQIQAYRVTGEKIYLDRAARTTVAYLDKLQQPNGLFFHGENAPFYWGRGNGWMAAGLAEVISELPEDHPMYPAIEGGYRKMMDALLDYQCENGMWRQLIDNESAWEEASCTGMFGYAICVGVQKGILPKESFEPSYQKAWLALADHIDEEGKVSDVCVGTGQSLDVNYYLERPVITGDFHGQAPVLWLSFSLLEGYFFRTK
jgi:rhamnogalacturonyl hydrolase YesR